MIFTSEDQLSYNNATHCHICELPLKRGAALVTASNDEISQSETIVI